MTAAALVMWLLDPLIHGSAMGIVAGVDTERKNGAATVVALPCSPAIAIGGCGGRKQDEGGQAEGDSREERFHLLC